MNRIMRLTALMCVLVVGLIELCALAGGRAATGDGAAGAGGAREAFAFPGRILEPQQKAAIIRLNAEVDDMMTRSIKRRVDLAGKMGCSVLIFEIDTLGGQLTSAIDICQYIKELPAKKFITVAWVHHKAYSAGAMIVASCQHVLMSNTSSYGLCAPIAITTTLTGPELVPLPAAERAKMEGPVVQQFMDSAERNGWNADALKAMVVVDEQVHEMLNKTTGDTIFVGDKRKAELLAVEAAAPGGDAAAKIRPWQWIRAVDDNKSLLTVSADQAIKMGLSRGTVETEQDVREICNIRGDVTILSFSWAERATVFLTAWSIRFFLFVGLVVFGLLEFSHPGVTIFGIAALICLILLIGAPFLTGLAQVWEIALIVVGLAIIITDLVAFGGIGVLAVPGFLLMGIGIIASFIPADPGGFMSSQSAWGAAQKGLGVVVGGTFLAIGAFWVLTKYLSITPGFNRLQLIPGGRRGAIAVALEPDVRDVTDRPVLDAVFIGALGRAATDLRPSGKARFGDHLVGVVSYGSFIEKDSEVEVLEISGLKVVVKPRVIAAPAPPDAPPGPPGESSPPPLP